MVGSSGGLQQPFWRSRRSNQINAWYHNVSHGHYRRHGEKDWVIFYRGLHPGRDSDEIDKCIDIACNLESSWRSAEAPNEDNYTGSNKKSVSAAYFSNPSYSGHALRKADNCGRGSSGRVDKRSFSTSSGKPTTVGLLGARGYVGVELLRLIADHPSFQLTHASSRSLIGENVGDVVKKQVEEQGLDISQDGVEDLKRVTFSNMSPADCRDAKVDLWFLALPNGLAEPYVDVLAPEGVKMIDLSADYRFNDDWVYGIPEMNREKIKGSNFISNPGCYATGAQLALLPLLDQTRSNVEETALPKLKSDSYPSIFGVSGYSGAGTTPSDKNNVDLLRDNLMAYKLTDHIHEREISRHLGHTVNFMPHVGRISVGYT